jgi:hypothetical protein
MVSVEYLLVKGAIPIAANFLVEISGLTEHCLHRQSEEIITEKLHRFQEKRCNIYFIELIPLEDIIHSAHFGRRIGQSANQASNWQQAATGNVGILE